MLFVAVACGGALGAVLRYAMSVALATAGAAFPLSTLAVNVLGAFLLGVAYSYSMQLSPTFDAFIRVGILGAFTTFSTFSLEAFSLFEQGRFGVALVYIVLSVALSIGAFALSYLWLR